jgi:hypothetical protein
MDELESLSCNVVWPPFYSSRGTYKNAKPRHVGLGTKWKGYIIEVTNASDP